MTTEAGTTSFTCLSVCTAPPSPSGLAGQLPLQRAAGQQLARLLTAAQDPTLLPEICAERPPADENFLAERPPTLELSGKVSSFRPLPPISATKRLKTALYRPHETTNRWGC